MNVMDRVVDAVDIETFLVCSSEDEGRKLAKELAKQLGFLDVDIVFIKYIKPGVRVRIRGTLQRVGDEYQWLKTVRGDEHEQFR